MTMSRCRLAFRAEYGFIPKWICFAIIICSHIGHVHISNSSPLFAGMKHPITAFTKVENRRWLVGR